MAEVLKGQVTEPGHPLQGAELIIRWSSKDSMCVHADVRILAPEDNVFARWVPVQLMHDHLSPGPEAA